MATKMAELGSESTCLYLLSRVVIIRVSNFHMCLYGGPPTHYVNWAHLHIQYGCQNGHYFLVNALQTLILIGWLSMAVFFYMFICWGSILQCIEILLICILKLVTKMAELSS